MKKLAGLVFGIAVSALTLASDGALAATECNGVLSGTIVGGVVVMIPVSVPSGYPTMIFEECH